jgi:hypothetical protein
MVLHHQSFEQPPAALALDTPPAARDSSPRSPLSPRDRVSPCALAAFLWKRSHSHGLARNQVSPWLSRSSIAWCSCGVPPATFAPSRALVAIASCSRDVPRATLTLSRGPINDQAAIAVGLPLSSGCHRRRAVIIATFPKATSERPICRWATSLPYSLGLPSNALFIIAIGLLSSPCPLSYEQFVSVAG